jgi:hypothetical protein
MSSTTPKTVFILGAGASQEANLPVGSQLTKLIASALDIEFKLGGFAGELLSGDLRIVEALRLAAQRNADLIRNMQLLMQAAQRVHAAMPQATSIDAFIDSHRGDRQIELCGKLAIVSTILEAEAKSYMFVDHDHGVHRLNFVQMADTWFNSFVQLLTENCHSSELVQRLKSVALIIFSYDRCVEHYLYYAIQNFYGIAPSEVAQLLRGLEIYHPYGTVGSLPWLDSAYAIEFGETPNSDKLLQQAGQIKTFTEGTDKSSSDVDAIRSLMMTSEKLVFLGFAFHRLNMELLLPSGTFQNQSGGRYVFGTASGISDSDTDSIRSNLTQGVLFVNHTRIRNDLTCKELFHEYRRSLSFV